jgi:hypothetical protein
MRGSPAIAIALLGVALAVAGCGLGPGDDLGSVDLTVTRDYGADAVVEPAEAGVTESDTVMRVLDSSAEITTRYGGGFVQSIEGLEAAQGSEGSWDWFFYVDGVEASVGAADYPLRGGEAIWWDYREWSAAMRVPAVVGSWPHPFAGGYEGKDRPTAVDCRGGAAVCLAVAERLRGAGATLVPTARSEGALRVLVGPWRRLREDPAAALIERGPGVSGVFAELLTLGRKTVLLGHREDGEIGRRFDHRSGLVAAVRHLNGPPAWVVTGPTAAGVRAAAGLLDQASLRDHYAVAIEGGEEYPLPLGS